MQITINRDCRVVLLGASRDNDQTRINCELFNGEKMCGYMILTMNNNELPGGIKVGDSLELSLVIE